MKKRISTFIVNLPGIKQYIEKKFAKNMVKFQEELFKEFDKSRDKRKSHTLPEYGMSEKNLTDRINQYY